MGLSKTEVNLRRLLEAAPQQKNQAKLIHYVATLREQLEQLAAETTVDGQPSISKEKVNEYSEMIEAIAAKLAVPSIEESRSGMEEVGTNISGLGRRFAPHTREEDRTRESDPLTPVKLDAPAKARIERHRKLQEDLTDEMVGLAQQLKESSRTMNRSLGDREKILDSTERAVEHSLASTRRAKDRTIDRRKRERYFESFKIICVTWLIIFAMTFILVMVVLLIRVT